MAKESTMIRAESLFVWRTDTNVGSNNGLDSIGLDALVHPLLERLAEATWGYDCRNRRTNYQLDRQGRTWTAVGYRDPVRREGFVIRLKRDKAGIAHSFIIRCQGGEIETADVSASALAQACKRAAQVGPKEC
jgi:hypothetical protein